MDHPYQRLPAGADVREDGRAARTAPLGGLRRHARRHSAAHRDVPAAVPEVPGDTVVRPSIALSPVPDGRRASDVDTVRVSVRPGHSGAAQRQGTVRLLETATARTATTSAHPDELAELGPYNGTWFAAPPSARTPSGRWEFLSSAQSAWYRTSFSGSRVTQLVGGRGLRSALAVHTSNPRGAPAAGLLAHGTTPVYKRRYTPTASAAAQDHTRERPPASGAGAESKGAVDLAGDGSANAPGPADAIQWRLRFSDGSLAHHHTVGRSSRWTPVPSEAHPKLPTGDIHDAVLAAQRAAEQAEAAAAAAARASAQSHDTCMGPLLGVATLDAELDQFVGSEGHGWAVDLGSHSHQHAHRRGCCQRHRVGRATGSQAWHAGVSRPTHALAHMTRLDRNCAEITVHPSSGLLVVCWHDGDAQHGRIVDFRSLCAYDEAPAAHLCLAVSLPRESMWAQLESVRVFPCEPKEAIRMSVRQAHVFGMTPIQPASRWGCWRRRRAGHARLTRSKSDAGVQHAGSVNRARSLSFQHGHTRPIELTRDQQLVLAGTTRSIEATTGTGGKFKGTVFYEQYLLLLSGLWACQSGRKRKRYIAVVAMKALLTLVPVGLYVAAPYTPVCSTYGAFAVSRDRGAIGVCFGVVGGRRLCCCWRVTLAWYCTTGVLPPAECHHPVDHVRAARHHGRLRSRAEHPHR